MKASAGEVKAFHVNCKYTGLLICTCAHGAGPSVKTKKANFAASLKAFYESSDLFEGMYCDIALPPLKPKFPLTQAKKVQGWSVAELATVFGEEQARILLESSFTTKQLKQVRQSYYGGQISLSDYGHVRIKLEDAKKFLGVQRAAVEGLEAKAARLKEEAKTFQEEAEREFELERKAAGEEVQGEGQGEEGSRGPDAEGRAQEGGPARGGESLAKSLGRSEQVKVAAARGAPARGASREGGRPRIGGGVGSGDAGREERNERLSVPRGKRIKKRKSRGVTNLNLVVEWLNEQPAAASADVAAAPAPQSSADAAVEQQEEQDLRSVSLGLRLRK